MLNGCLMLPSISLVICSRNRASQLERTLKACEAMNSTISWELVLIDNGSTDSTPELMKRFAAKSQLPIVLGTEPIAGLSRARNRGIRLSRAPVLAFTDDDCYPDSELLVRLHQQMLDMSIGFCGGRVMLFDPKDLSITVQESTQPRHFGSPGDDITPGQLLGANMAIRREALIVCRGFDERLGAGSRFKSGEDTDLFRRLLEQGIKGAFFPDLVVYHHHGRQTETDRLGLINNYSWGRGAAKAKQLLTQPDKKRLLKHWYWNLRNVSGAQLRRELLSAFLFACLTRFSPELCRLHPAESLMRDEALN